MACNIDAVLKAASFKLRSYNEAACLSHSLFFSQKIWVPIRGLLACYSLSIVIWSLVESDKFYATFLTYWMLYTQATYLSVAFTVSLIMLELPAPQPPPDPQQHGGSDWVVSPMIDDILTIKWVLRSIVTPGALLVMVGYWAFVSANPAGGTSALTVHAHGVNFVLIFVDATFSASATHLAHVWTLFTFGVAYIAFTVSYFYSTNDSVYVPTDYSRPGISSATVLVALFVGVPLAALVIWGYYHLRNAIAFYVFGLEREPRLPSSRSPIGGRIHRGEVKQDTTPTDGVIDELAKAEQARDTPIPSA